jgi:hypothetical protein
MATMRLSRESFSWYQEYTGESNYCSKASDDFQIAPSGGDTPCAYASFARFGNGKSRTSDFTVSVEWKDVLAFVEKFCEAGHSDALALREAVKLAAAARDLGWCPPENAATSN